MMLSSTPVTVTVCAEFQFAGVKVSEPETVDSLVSTQVMVPTTWVVWCSVEAAVKKTMVADSATKVDPQ